ncbi:MAG: hypothetical protein JNM62_12470 [Flavobacteriales bacterium]|nr:hypothetical protein [Flavobacteriales bacterium]
MKHMRWATPILLLLAACTAKPQATEPAPVVETVHSNLLTVADIRIAAGVDTTHAATLDAINCLRRFLTRKMDPEAPSDYWYAPDMEDYGGPYAELLYAEFDSVGRYRPTVLEARPAGEGDPAALAPIAVSTATLPIVQAVILPRFAAMATCLDVHRDRIGGQVRHHSRASTTSLEDKYDIT